MNTQFTPLRIPEDEYHAASRRGEYLSSHLLADFRKSPLLYRRETTGLVPPRDSAAFAFGRAVHKLALEGREEFDKEYFVGPGPVNPKTNEPFGPLTKAYKDWAAQLAPRIVMSPSAFASVDRIAKSVRAHSVAAKLLSEGTPEGTVRTHYAGLNCQIRMDWLNPVEGIVDLKTCEDLDRFEFDAKKYGYMEQMAFYRAVLRVELLGETVPVHIVAVEKSEPFRCGVWLLAPESLDRCEKANEDAMRRLRECALGESWPSGYEELRTLAFAS